MKGKKIMKRILVAGISLLLLSTSIWAQQTDSTLSFTLEQAQQYALQNSPVIKNANLDLESAKKKVWETTAMGLPQASAKYSYTYMLTVPEIVKSFSGSDFSSIGNNIGDIYQYIGMLANGADGAVKHILDSISNIPQTPKKDNTDDVRWSSNIDFTVSQLIFSGAYIVGLQTSKVFKSLSEIGVTKSSNDLKESVSNAYFSILVMKENKEITDSSYMNVLKLYNDMQSMQKQGFIDETDVDQLSITVSNLKSASDMLARQVEIMENLLKFQIGLDLKRKIVLQDNIEGHLMKFEQNIALKEFVVENYSDYQLLDAQAKMMNLNVKLQKSAFLPDIAAFYTYHKAMNTNALDFQAKDMVGISVSMPIFSSGQRLSKVSQARMGYQKAINTREQVATGLKIEFETTKSNYISAKEKYLTDKKNLEVSKRIYNRSIIKYKNGTISSTELTQVQNQYFTTQGTYYSSLLSLINAENKLNKLLGN